MEFPSYIDDLHCGLYDERTSFRRLDEVERREGMGDLVDRVSVVIKEVPAERGLPLAEDKEERLILRGGSGRRGKRGIGERVKWLVVILDEDLDFGPHWTTRIIRKKNLAPSPPSPPTDTRSDP